MTDLHDQTAAAARTVLAENGASSPSTDTDTLAGLIATAVIQAAKEYAASQVDPAAELAAAPVPETPEEGVPV